MLIDSYRCHAPPCAASIGAVRLGLNVKLDIAVLRGHSGALQENTHTDTHTHIFSRTDEEWLRECDSVVSQ